VARRQPGWRPGKSHLARALAAVSVLLGLLSATFPAVLAGSPGAALAGLLLFACSAGTAAAAWRLADGARRKAADAAQSRLRLLEAVAAALKDPAHTIGGFSGLLETPAGAGPESAEFRNACRFIREAGEDLGRFAASLQDFVRHEQGRVVLAGQQVDAAELVAAALGPCRRPAESADVVILATLLEGVEVSCDAQRLGSAVTGLVLWAAAAAPARSVIAVTLLRTEDDALAISVKSLAHLPPAGGGDPFREPRIGRDGLNGLALPIARRVALLHSGGLTIDSDPVTGCTARLVLPPGRVTWPDRAETRDSRAA
jgi:signal transduction histidine kinase